MESSILTFPWPRREFRAWWWSTSGRTSRGRHSWRLASHPLDSVVQELNNKLLKEWAGRNVPKNPASGFFHDQDHQVLHSLRPRDRRIALLRQPRLRRDPKFLPPHQNLWVNLGSGRAPRLW